MSRRTRSSRPVPAPHMQLPPVERRKAHELEMTHGVIVRVDEHEGIVQALDWQTDEVLADADTVYELETVLKSLHIYADVEAAAVVPSDINKDIAWRQP